MTNEWEIKSRGNKCSATGREFTEGEFFYTLLFRERGGGFSREDLCEEAWQGRDQGRAPFSFWRAKYEPPAPPAPEALAKETAEDLLRRLMLEESAQQRNARYILALMLERKRILKPVEVKEEEGERILIYEHAKTGEAFLILDPQLRLDQVEEVQNEVMGLLGA